MSGMRVLEQARHSAGLSQQELAERARTSRTAVSAYERGRKSPSLETFERLLAAAGYAIDLRQCLMFHEVAGRQGHTYAVPNGLPQLRPQDALAWVELPLRLNWSEPGRVFRMAERRDRARLYEIVMREGEGADIERYVDGALLVDLWEELVLPKEVRAAWSPLVEALRSTVQ